MTPDQLAAAIRHALVRAIEEGALALEPAQIPDEVTVERPRNPEHGDYATNVALQLAKPAGSSPRAVAEAVATRLRRGRGRRRGRRRRSGLPQHHPRRRDARASWPARSSSRASPTAGSTATPGRAFNVEFISANPTGPLHLGHTRWAAVGRRDRPGARGRGRRRRPRVLLQRPRRCRWTSSACRSRRVRSAPSRPRTATTAPTSTTSRSRSSRPTRRSSTCADDDALGGLPRGGLRPEVRAAAGRPRRLRHALRRLVLRAHAALERRRRARPREAARARAHVRGRRRRVAAHHRLRRRQGPRPRPRPTASSPTSPATPPTTSTSASAASTSASTCSAPTTTATSTGCGRWRRAPATTPTSTSRCSSASSSTWSRTARRCGCPSAPATSSRSRTSSTRSASTPRATRWSAIPSTARSPSTSTCWSRAATTTRSTTCSTRTPGSRRCCATPPSSGSTGGRADADLSLLTHEREAELLGLSASSRAWSARPPELREPHRVARYLEELADGYHKFYDVCRVLPGDDAEVEPINAPGCGCARPRARRSRTASPCSASPPPSGCSRPGSGGCGDPAWLASLACRMRAHPAGPRHGEILAPPERRRCPSTPRRCTPSPPGSGRRRTSRADAGGLLPRSVSIAGVDVRDLAASSARRCSSSTRPTSASRAAAFRAAYDDAEVPGDVFYAGKAFLSAPSRAGSPRRGSASTSAPAATAHRARAPASPRTRIALPRQQQDVAELELALRARRRDASSSTPFEEIARLAAAAERAGVGGRVLVRVTVGVEAHTHEFIATAHEDQKFGFSLAGGRGRGGGAAHRELPVAARSSGCTPTSARRSSTPPASRSPRTASSGSPRGSATSTASRSTSSTSAAAWASPTLDDDDPMTPQDDGRPAARDRRARVRGVRAPAVPRIAVEPGRAIVGPAMITRLRGRHGQGGRPRPGHSPTLRQRRRRHERQHPHRPLRRRVHRAARLAGLRRRRRC